MKLGISIVLLACAIFYLVIVIRDYLYKRRVKRYLEGLTKEDWE